VPLQAAVGAGTLTWTAPGDDLMCGTASSYEVVTSANPITAQNFAAATPVPGAPAPAAAGTSQSFALPPRALQYVAIRAVDEQGNVGLPAAGPALPALGRCVKVARKTGEYAGAKCLTERHGLGNYDFLPGPGAAKKFTAQLGAVTLETTGAKKITCSAGTGTGEYTGAKTETLTLTLSGCERPATHSACQSVAAASGQIVTNQLEGRLGFIRSGSKAIVGLDLAREGALATFECVSSAPGGKEVVTLEGSAIGMVKPIDRMSSHFTDAYTQKAGHQSPEQFEGGLKDTLTSSIVAGLEKSSEQTGLATTLTVTGEEPLEIKAKP